MKNKTGEESKYWKIKKFLENSEVGNEMVAPLRRGCVVHVDVDGEDHKYELVKQGCKCVLQVRKSRRAEMAFVLSPGSIDYILEPPPACAHDLMNRYFDCLLEKEGERKAGLIIHAGLLECATKGYLKMLMLGGRRAVPTLVALGVKLPRRLHR